MKHRATLYTLFLFALLPLQAFAQALGCDGQRYRTTVFTDVTVTEAIKFGENTTIGGNFQELYMDVYEPTDDELEARPAVVLAFGGGFVEGSRQSLDGICRTLASKGFVAATIDYRLFDQGIPVSINQMYDVVVKATGDMKAAIRFLREDAATDNQFRIDADFVFAGGISAGAITAAHVAYLEETDDIASNIETAIEDNGGFEGNSSTNTQYSSEVQGVINYSGALSAASYIDSNEPPLFSVHDDGDAVVPYGNGSVPAGPFVFVYLEGSQSMHAQAEAAGIDNELITIENSNSHVSYFLENADDYEQEVEEATANFLGDILCGPLSSLEEAKAGEQKLDIFPNPASSGLTLSFKDVMVEAYHINIYNSAGQLVLQKNGLSGQRQHVAIAPLQPGYYTLEVEFLDQTETSIRRKLVVVNP